MQPIRQEEQENEKAYANNLYIKKFCLDLENDM